MSIDRTRHADEQAIRFLICELLRFQNIGDVQAVQRIYHELRDAMSRPVLSRSTVRRVPS